ncbi:MAG: DMT family transporter [Gammaproteobacteria bacterium]|nr:DMT family transporter [Gammaproteobacteria bacterium]MDE0283444.1 DMT family transporter [Gammaproteobacteria bacterium]MDE0513548.1 DMT family transporter [Gammaproteobacteria bacterium]MYH70490.1 DMT family transporter [Gammaproteobacteria bacterium]
MTGTKLSDDSLFRTRSGLYACLVLTLASAAFAFAHVVGRGIHSEVPPVGLSFWRWLLGAIVLFPFIYPSLKVNAPDIRRHIGPLTLLGGIMIVSATLLMIGLNFTTAINASIINAIQPVSTVLLAMLILHDRLRLSQSCGVALGFIGVIAMIARMDPVALVRVQFNAGDILILLGSIGYSLYAINLRKIPNTLSPSAALFMIIVTGCVIVLPFYVIETILYKPVPISAHAIYAIVALSLVSTVFGTLMWNQGNQLIGPSRAGMFINLIPVFAAIMAIIFLGERLHQYQVICAALICGGIFLVLRR